MGKTEGEEIVTERTDRNEVLLDMIASGYTTISGQDKEIQKLKYELSVLTQSNERLYENFKTLSKKFQHLESADIADIDDGR
jgi:predicted nuclease with TOPRIM domain